MSTEQERFYGIYKDNVLKFGRKWARELGQYDKRRSNPYAQVLKDANAVLRRYLGADNFAKYISKMEYLLLMDGLAVKDEHNRLDVPEQVFNEWIS